MTLSLELTSSLALIENSLQVPVLLLHIRSTPGAPPSMCRLISNGPCCWEFVSRLDIVGHFISVSAAR